MKALTISVIAAFYAAISMGQSSSNLYTSETLSNQSNITEQSQQASVVKTKYSDKFSKTYYYDNPEDVCGRYHRMTIAGIVLTAVGGGMFIAGATVAAAAPPPAYVVDGNGYYYPAYNPQRATGNAIMTTGIISMSVGVPLLVVGSVRNRRYCRGGYQGRSYLELKNGNSLALKF